MADQPILRYAVLAFSVLAIGHDIVGLAINPDFGVGSSARTEEFHGVDYNGWHAVLGFVVFGPGLYLWRRADWAQLYALAIIFGLLSTAIWGLLDDNPLGVLSLPDQDADAIFHVTIASLYVLVLAAQAVAETRRRSGPTAT
jgi:hypothetical protein